MYSNYQASKSNYIYGFASPNKSQPTHYPYTNLSGQPMLRGNLPIVINPHEGSSTININLNIALGNHQPPSFPLQPLLMSTTTPTYQTSHYVNPYPLQMQFPTLPKVMECTPPIRFNYLQPAAPIQSSHKPQQQFKLLESVYQASQQSLNTKFRVEDRRETVAQEDIVRGGFDTQNQKLRTTSSVCLSQKSEAHRANPSQKDLKFVNSPENQKHLVTGQFLQQDNTQTPRLLKRHSSNSVRSNHSQAHSNHSQAHSNHSQAHSNHSQAHSNHSQAHSNHSQAHSNHSQARSNHSHSYINQIITYQHLEQPLKTQHSLHQENGSQKRIIQQNEVANVVPISIRPAQTTQTNFLTQEKPRPQSQIYASQAAVAPEPKSTSEIKSSKQSVSRLKKSRAMGGGSVPSNHSGSDPLPPMQSEIDRLKELQSLRSQSSLSKLSQPGALEQPIQPQHNAVSNHNPFLKKATHEEVDSLSKVSKVVEKPVQINKQHQVQVRNEPVSLEINKQAVPAGIPPAVQIQPIHIYPPSPTLNYNQSPLVQPIQNQPVSSERGNSNSHMLILGEETVLQDNAMPPTKNKRQKKAASPLIQQKPNKPVHTRKNKIFQPSLDQSFVLSRIGQSRAFASPCRLDKSCDLQRGSKSAKFGQFGWSRETVRVPGAVAGFWKEHSRQRHKIFGEYKL